MLKRFLFGMLALASLSTGPALAEVYTVDSTHSGISFRIRHLISEAEGRFNNFKGTVDFDPADYAKTKVNFTIQADSIDTGNAKRDTHLKSADFFEVEKYPTLTFVSTSAKKTGDKTMDVTGDMTIHGKTRRMTVPVRVFGPTDPDKDGSRSAGFQTEFNLSRADFGVNSWTDKSGVLGDEVKARVTIEAHSNWKD